VLRAGPLTVVSLAVATALLVRRVDGWAVRAEAGVRVTVDGEPAPLPGFIATDWIGQFAPVTDVEREVLPADTGYSRRNYVSTHDRRRQVFLSVVLSGQDRTSIHRPELCVVGQGWTIVGRDAAQLVHPQGGHVPVATLRLARELQTRRGERQRVESLLVYWFVGRDAVTASIWDRMWRTALNRLRLRPDRWAYVVAQTLLLPGETETAARERVQEVLTGTLPAIQPGTDGAAKPGSLER
jgi:EpsI family protein